MSAPDLVELLALRQGLEGELADCLEHPEPVLAVPDEALLDERSEGVEVRVGDLLGCRESEAADEDCEPREEPAFRLIEKLIAPGNCVPERALAVRDVACSSGQHREPFVEPLEQGGRRENLRPGRSQLDPQRETV